MAAIFAVDCPVGIAALFVVGQNARPCVIRVDDLLQVTGGRPDDLDKGGILIFAPLFDL
jgi:hypothetical protein